MSNVEDFENEGNPAPTGGDEGGVDGDNTGGTTGDNNTGGTTGDNNTGTDGGNVGGDNA